MHWGARAWREVVYGLSGGIVLGLARERDEAHLLSSPQRLHIYRLILARPGVSLRELAQRLETTWSNVKYHTLRLEAAGLIGSHVVGRHRVCYPKQTPDVAIVEARGILTEDATRRIALFIVAHPGSSISRVIEETGESQRAVYYHVRRLVQGGLVALGSERGYRGLVPTTKLFAALE